MRGLLALWTLALILPSLAPNLVALCGALFVYGATAGMADVVMNAIGVEVEHRMGKSIMSGLHGMWSVGALIGSGIGTVAAHLEISAQLHHLVMAVVLTVLGAIACQYVLNLHPTEEEEAPPHFALPPKSALLIGAVGFCAVFAEGASLDWSAVYLEDVLDHLGRRRRRCDHGLRADDGDRPARRRRGGRPVRRRPDGPCQAG